VTKPDLIIQIKKVRDSKPTLVSIRADGTRTWGQLHAFFPEHDLTHFAVESVMQCRNAFFGLISQGWSIDDFALPGAAQRLPFEALWVENIVMLIERGGLQSASELNEHLSLLTNAQAEQAFRFTSAQWESICAERAARLQQWRELVDGETMEIHFVVGG
jgi:hypothetical protein